MSAYALLGATGTVGNYILRALAEDSNREIHAFVRSKSKLERMSPDICSSPRLRVFEGDISNTTVLEQCLTGTRTVFMAVADSYNKAGARAAQNQAEAVVAALESMRRKDKNVKMPTLVVLSSAETEKKLCGNIPWLVEKVLFTANCHIYWDLMKAEEYLRAREEWVSCVFVKPGGLSHDVKRGHVLSTEKQQTFVSYWDMAYGMLEIGDAEGGRWEGKSVSVLSHGNAKIEKGALWAIPRGLLTYYCPWLYPYLP